MITSLSNEKIKRIRKLKDRKYRSESGLYFAEGTKLVLNALRMGEEVDQLLIAPDLIHTDGARRIIELSIERKIEILEVSEDVFESVSCKENPQGVAGVLIQKWCNIDKIFQEFSGIWLGLYEVADPGNLGTIMRTMDAVGGKGIFLIDNCTDPYDPTAIRASMGALFSLQVCKTTTQTFLTKIKEHSVYTIGTSDTAKLDFHQEKYNQNMILCMGSEREGLPAEISSVCNSMVSIPMLGISDSLNLAVATGVVLYEILSKFMNLKN